jgi:chemotaxis signal transduction protein
MRLVTENEENGLGLGAREPMTGISSPDSPSRFLIVILGGRYLALDAESIQGILTLEEVGYHGDPTIHGKVYRAINLADRLKISNDPGAANGRIVLLSERSARGSVRVTTVQGWLELHPSQVLPLPPQFRGPERHWYRGMILFADSIALSLNTTWLLNEQVSGVEHSGGQESIPRLAAVPSISVNDRRVC